MRRLPTLLVACALAPATRSSAPPSALDDATLDRANLADLRLLERVRQRIENRGSGYFFDYSLLHAGAVIYSIGVGSDISFDLSVLDGCRDCHARGLDHNEDQSQQSSRLHAISNLGRSQGHHFSSEEQLALRA